MSISTKTQNKATTDAGYEASRFAIIIGFGMAALIGLWGMACLIGGLATNGIGGLLKGLITAVTGN